MKKAIYMQAQMHAGGGADAAQIVRQELSAAFAQANPGMQLTIKSVSPADAGGNVTVAVYIEGEQDPAADFAALAGDAFHQAIGGLSSTRSLGAAPLAVQSLREVENDDEESGVVLPPPAAAAAAAPPSPPSAPSAPAAAPPAAPAAAVAPGSLAPAGDGLPPPPAPSPAASGAAGAPPSRRPPRNSSGKHRRGR